MSTDTVLEAILDAVALAMTGINGTGSYETTVKSVNEEPTNHATEADGLAPSLDITLGKRDANDGQGSPRAMFGAEIREATIDIYGVVLLAETLVDGVSKRQKPHKAWLPLARDVERIVKANRTWGGIALKTEIGELVPEYAADAVAFNQQIRVQYLVPRA